MEFGSVCVRIGYCVNYELGECISTLSAVIA